MVRTLTVLLVMGAIVTSSSAQLVPPEPTPSTSAAESDVLPVTDDEDGVGALDPCRSVKDGSLFKPLGEIKTRIPTKMDRMPPDCSSEFFTASTPTGSNRFGTDLAYHWQPTNFFHMPTYFDDVPLERYGQTANECLQPFLSGTRFFLQVPILPYKMGVNPPHECISTLGHRPPGDCVPCIKQTLPFEADAVAVQAAATVGFVFLLP